MSAPSGRRLFTDYSDDAWQASLFRLVLIALLAGSVASGPATARVALGGTWPGYLLPVAILVAAAGVATTTQLGRPTWRDRRGAAFRLGELLLLLAGERVLVWVFGEGLPGVGTLRNWLLHPGSFFTGEYTFAVLVWLFVWFLAVLTTSDFRELAIQPDEVAARESHEWGDSRSQWRVARPLGRGDLLQGFAYRWIGVGIFLVVCAGMTRISVTVGDRSIVHFGLGGLGLRAEVVASLVCYFLAGLLLISQGRLAVLRGRWFNQEVEIRETLVRRWHLYSLIFILLVAAAALLLPLGSTGWFVGVIEWVIALLIRAVLFVGFLFGFLLALLIGLISRLFGSNGQGAPPEALRPPTEAVPSQAQVANQLPPWLGGAVLWLVVAVVAGILLVNFLRTTGLLQSRFGHRATEWRLWWRARRARLGARVRTQVNSVRRRLGRARRRAGPLRQPVETGQRLLLPRDQVRRYYLAAVKEAGEEGVARSPDATPLEYAEDLAKGWPESDSAVRELTEAFMDARYSQREIGSPEVTGAENAWRRFVRALRGKPRP